MHTISQIWKLAILAGGVTNCFLISPSWSQTQGASFEPQIGGQNFRHYQSFSPSAGISSKFQVDSLRKGNFDALPRVQEVQTRKAVSILDQQGKTATAVQLHDLNWQKGLIETKQLNHPFTRAATAWWWQNKDVPLPPTFFRTLSSSHYFIERLSEYRDSLEEPADVDLPRAVWDGRDKIEVDTVEAKRTILTKISFEIGEENDAVSNSIRDDARRIDGCSAAVKMLRKPSYQTGKNVLDHFDEICLSESNTRILTDAQRIQAIECLDLYATYDKACFYDRYDKAEAALAPLGVLFKAGDQLATTIRCTAYRISRDILLTARHCLDHDVMLDSYTMRNNVLFFQPFQHQISQREMISIAWSQGRPAGCSIIRIIDPTNFDLKVEVPTADKIEPEDDMVLLQVTLCPKQMSDEYNSAEQLKLRVDATPKPFEPLVLAGFNDMVFRIALLRARLEDRKLPGDLELLVDGSWRQFVRQDESAVCRIGSIESPLRQRDPSLRQLGHYCQTQPGMSGAPLIAMRNVTRRQAKMLNDGEDPRVVVEPVLVGIHRRAPGMGARLNGDIPERNGPPNVGISLGAQVSANLTKLIQ